MISVYSSSIEVLLRFAWFSPWLYRSHTALPDHLAVCPTGWIESSHSRTCIKVYEDRKFWQDARDKCKADHGELVKILDFSMNQLIMCENNTCIYYLKHTFLLTMPVKIGRLDTLNLSTCPEYNLFKRL